MDSIRVDYIRKRREFEAWLGAVKGMPGVSGSQRAQLERRQPARPRRRAGAREAPRALHRGLGPVLRGSPRGEGGAHDNNPSHMVVEAATTHARGRLCDPFGLTANYAAGAAGC